MCPILAKKWKKRDNIVKIPKFAQIGCFSSDIFFYDTHILTNWICVIKCIFLYNITQTRAPQRFPLIFYEFSSEGLHCWLRAYFMQKIFFFDVDAGISGLLRTMLESLLYIIMWVYQPDFGEKMENKNTKMSKITNTHKSAMFERRYRIL